MNMKKFDSDVREQMVTLDGGAMAKLLPVGNPFWRVRVEYFNQTAQDIPCYNDTSTFTCAVFML